MTSTCRRSLLLAAAVAWGLAGSTFAARPTDTIFPDTTRGFVSVADAKLLGASWRQTQLGQLWNDPAMQPFVEDLGDQLRSNYGGFLTDLGLSLEDLENVASAEVGFALISPAKGRAGMVLLVDVAGNEDKVRELMSRADSKLREQKAKKSERKLGEVTITVFERSEPDSQDVDAPPIIHHVAYWLSGSWFGASSEVPLAEDVLKRTQAEQTDHLASVAAYQAVMKRCQSGAGDLVPHARWFVEPLALATSLRTLGQRKKPEGTDMLKVLHNQGFTAIRGVGGFVNLVAGRYDLVHRTYVFAPPPYEKAMRMVVLPNGADLAPQNWVPANIALYASVRWDMKNAFEMASTLFDELFGEGEEGVFEETLASIRDDPNGPGIDVRKDLIAHIGERATVVLDYEMPITPTSERMVFAAETTNESALAVAIEKSMAGDPTVTKREYLGKVIWEIKEEELPEAPTVELGDELGLESPSPVVEEPASEEEDKEERLLGTSSIMVAHGHIFVSSHPDYLQKILDQIANGAPSLASTPDYQQVKDEMRKLGASPLSMEMFRRTENEHRCTYELLRQGKMPESQTMLGRLLNRAFAAREGEVRKSQIDGEKLPPYEHVQRYFGPAGMFLVSEAEGWFLTGFTLPKAGPAAAASPADNVRR